VVAVIDNNDNTIHLLDDDESDEGNDVSESIR
jgi:hypothetical protein